MLHIPSILGALGRPDRRSSQRPGRRRKIRSATAGTSATTAAKVPLPVYKQRKHMAGSSRVGYQPPNECIIFRYCDDCYSKLWPEHKAEWAAAVKAPRMSAYDLWMSESLWLCNQGYPPPDHPSISGGFSPVKARPGIRFPAPDLPDCKHPDSPIIALWLQWPFPPPYPYCNLHFAIAPLPYPGVSPYNQVEILSWWIPSPPQWLCYQSQLAKTGPVWFLKPRDPDNPVLVKFTRFTSKQTYSIIAALTEHHPWYIARFNQRPWWPPPDYTWPF